MPLCCNVAANSSADMKDKARFALQHSVWAACRAHLAGLGYEHVFIVAAPRPFDILEKHPYLERTHIIISVQVSACSLGFPVRSAYTLSFGISRADMVWTGPNIWDTEEDFGHRFHRDVCHSGALYFDGDEDEVFASNTLRAATLRKPFS